MFFSNQFLYFAQKAKSKRPEDKHGEVDAYVEVKTSRAKVPGDPEKLGPGEIQCSNPSFQSLSQYVPGSKLPLFLYNRG